MPDTPAASSTIRIPRAGGEEWQLEVYERLGSTSDLCKTRLEAGRGANGVAVLALEQTAGRGSRGREWTDPGGNLALSIMLTGQGTDVPVGLWPFIAGLALYEAVACFLPTDKTLELKWPNDLLLAGRKMAGILIETGAAADVAWQVIGIGVNLRQAPVIAGRELACLADYGQDVPAAPAMARIMLQELDTWLVRYTTSGFDAIRTAWLERAHPVGTPIGVKAGNQQFNGHFYGLADDGILLLQTPSGLRRVVTGEVLLAPTGQE